MTKWKFNVIGAALILSGTFTAWAAAHNPSNIGSPDDGQINAEVREAITQHRDLGAPNQIYVQTRDHVVFLSGWVDNSLSADNAIEIAGKVPGVTRVVSTIAVDK
jgi:osmotically-inducible protein OsmY